MSTLISTTSPKNKKEIIVGVSGASGVEMSLSLLRALKRHPLTLHLVMTRGALKTWGLESRRPLTALTSLADIVHDDDDLAASIASGSHQTEGLIVLPCSMKTLSAVTHGFSAGLLTRAADVCLKEGRRLLLCPREMPLSRVHLANMLRAAELGCVIMPPMLTFYNEPQRIEDLVEHLVGKILMSFGLQHQPFKAWKGELNCA